MKQSSTLKILFTSESLQYRVPYVSLYSRPSKKATMTFPTSCVHSPMPRIPSPYLRQSATEPSPRPVVSGRSCHPDNVKPVAQLTPRSPLPRELTIVKSSKRRSKGNINLEFWSYSNYFSRVSIMNVYLFRDIFDLALFKLTKTGTFV